MTLPPNALHPQESCEQPRMYKTLFKFNTPQGHITFGIGRDASDSLRYTVFVFRGLTMYRKYFFLYADRTYLQKDSHWKTWLSLNEADRPQLSEEEIAICDKVRQIALTTIALTGDPSVGLNNPPPPVPQKLNTGWLNGPTVFRPWASLEVL